MRKPDPAAVFRDPEVEAPCPGVGETNEGEFAGKEEPGEWLKEDGVAEELKDKFAFVAGPGLEWEYGCH